MEEMLEVPPECNEVPDLMMEEEDVLPEATGSTKGKRNEISRGGRKQRKEDNIWPEKQGNLATEISLGRRKRQKEDNIRLEKWGHFPTVSGDYKIQRDSILKIGIKFSKKKTSGKHQISGREFHRWCFVTEF